MSDKPTYRVRLHANYRRPYSRRDDCGPVFADARGLTFTNAQRKAGWWSNIGVHATVAVEPREAAIDGEEVDDD